MCGKLPKWPVKEGQHSGTVISKITNIWGRFTLHQNIDEQWNQAMIDWYCLLDLERLLLSVDDWGKKKSALLLRFRRKNRDEVFVGFSWAPPKKMRRCHTLSSAQYEWERMWYDKDKYMFNFFICYGMFKLRLTGPIDQSFSNGMWFNKYWSNSRVAPVGQI